MDKYKSIKAAVIYTFIAYLLLVNCFAQADAESDRLFPVKVKGKFGYVDTNGKMAIKPQFDEAHEFHEGLAGVLFGGKRREGRSGSVFYSGGKFGYINKSGKFVIPLGKFSFGRNFSEGLAEVSLNNCFASNCYGYADKSGRLVIKYQFSFASEFREGLAVVSLPNGKNGVIDKTGKFIVPAVYDGLLLGEGIVVANTRSTSDSQQLPMNLPIVQTVFLDKQGNTVARPKHFVFGMFSEGLTQVFIYVNYGTSVSELVGFVDRTGEFVIEPRFEKAKDFVNGLAPAKIKNRWGFIDRTGQFVIEPFYDEAESFKDGLAKVRTGGKTGFIDKKGKIVIEPRSWTVENFIDGHAFVTEDGFTGYIDKKGKFLWKTKF